MLVQTDPDNYWGFEPCGPHRGSIFVRVESEQGDRRSPRSQAERGLIGVKMLMNRLLCVLRRRTFGDVKGEFSWTMTITISSVADRLHGGEVYSSFSWPLPGSFIRSSDYSMISGAPT